MLNYSKIESLINYLQTPKTAIAKHLGIAESTLRNRLSKENLTPDDVEKLADFFKKPITYFFDHEDPPEVNDKVTNYGRCLGCEKKQEEIEKLRKEVDDLKNELLEVYRGKKENPIANSA